MMRTLKILLFLFISCLCFGCQSSLRRESRIEKQDDVYVLSFANLSFSVSAGKGGRIVSFKCEDRELLTSDSVHSKYYGATFWLSPQSEYWPQYQCVDELPYQAEIDKQILRFFVKFGGNLFFISTVFFFLNPIKSCRYVCFLVTLKTPHH